MKIKSFAATMVLVLSSAVSVVLTSCGAQGPTKETLDAVAALKKIQAGTQVGMNYQTYGQLLIEAKAKTNEATRTLPDGALKTELTGAMDAYADAATVWGIKIERHVLYGDSSEPDKSLIAKYHIPVTPPKYGSGPNTADPENALQLIWLRASFHLVEVSKLVGQEPKS